MLIKTNNYSSISLMLLLLILSPAIFGEDKFVVEDKNSLEQSINTFITNENKYTFFGLASYYNNINYYIINKNSIDIIELNSEIILKEGEWLAVAGRLKVFLIKGSGFSVVLNDSRVTIHTQSISSERTVRILSKQELSSTAIELDQIRYFHLWQPLALLAKVVESSLVIIQAYIVSSWGLTIIVFSILLKILLLPIGIMTTRFQRTVSQLQTQITPKLVHIKEKHTGEEAHDRLMEVYKELGVTPFFTLKPMLGSFIQIPILIAVFNALGEMPQFDEQSFLWIENLAYPDKIMNMSFSIVMFGNTLHLLPFMMTFITIYSTVVFQNKYAPEVEVKRQKRNLYIMAFVFFVLFYPFPAVMVLYWTLANILHTIQQQIIKV